MDYLLTFQSMHNVMKGEKALKALPIDATIMPLPIGLGDLCNMCLRVKQIDILEVVKVLKEKNVPLVEIFKIGGTDQERIYQKWQT
ncbi:DUF3343 domain-containing protein [Enterococcus sp. HY326]|uniref:DUF3343 domain-containing protein n=1 Tax=Enterococcus sp. HY326 TaxID=2971265 RepID=UPI00224060FF|nr:DUF3343 domain-containing protein [Enterococcus sp. HY326]